MLAALAALCLGAILALAEWGDDLPDLAYQLLRAVPLLHIPAVMATGLLRRRMFERRGIKLRPGKFHRWTLVQALAAWGALWPFFPTGNNMPLTYAGAILLGVLAAMAAYTAARIATKIDARAMRWEIWLIITVIQAVFVLGEAEHWTDPAPVAAMITASLCLGWDLLESRKKVERRC